MNSSPTSVPPRDRVLGGVLVAVLLAVQTIVMGRAILALDLALVVAFVVWLTTDWRREAPGLLTTYLLGIALFVIHFTEEYLTGFHRAFPALVGYEWQSSRFVAFNAMWGLILLAGAEGLRRGSAISYVIVLFFAVGGGVMNGIGHVLLAVQAGGYFPGLLTAPLMLVVGVVLLRKMYGTGPKESPRS